mmetsp:Transcript_39816/g.52473  ORF Transcript_39816/g.52473 Transcript_39816/m.52473 type:complete len:532 (+) Transcript_39816:112-1707(+)|eukprot:CAMPEP_0117739032 /NCGR_PEP_ID=MMETSP0947-20121206/3495_1 /TAXON_ID=44440 /ORGANISM="Chattonella subsalsa, Strain CCMP2191" /LENGTH=531 /DNA_ID=CAMNT_0005554859 /DNA_START=24 /DNA_END=1619 /DNA_ORIENTATION=+
MTEMQQPNQTEVNNAESTKTETIEKADCHFFMTTGCTKGDACLYRHSELAKSNPSVVCHFWMKGHCANGESCKFVHPSDMAMPHFMMPPQLPFSAVSGDKSKVPCHFFMSSKCLKGQACPFLHPGVESGIDNTKEKNQTKEEIQRNLTAPPINFDSKADLKTSSVTFGKNATLSFGRNSEKPSHRIQNSPSSAGRNTSPTFKVIQQSERSPNKPSLKRTKSFEEGELDEDDLRFELLKKKTQKLGSKPVTHQSDVERYNPRHGPERKFIRDLQDQYDEGGHVMTQQAFRDIRIASNRNGRSEQLNSTRNGRGLARQNNGGDKSDRYRKIQQGSVDDGWVSAGNEERWIKSGPVSKRSRKYPPDRFGQKPTEANGRNKLSEKKLHCQRTQTEKKTDFEVLSFEEIMARKKKNKGTEASEQQNEKKLSVQTKSKKKMDIQNSQQDTNFEVLPFEEIMKRKRDAAKSVPEKVEKTSHPRPAVTESKKSDLAQTQIQEKEKTPAKQPLESPNLKRTKSLDLDTELAEFEELMENI